MNFSDGRESQDLHISQGFHLFCELDWIKELRVGTLKGRFAIISQCRNLLGYAASRNEGSLNTSNLGTKVRGDIC
jgi:hypothetical protein